MGYPFPRTPSRFGLIEAGLIVVAITTAVWWWSRDFGSGCSLPFYTSIVNNLRVIQNQKQLWAADKKKTETDTPSEADLAEYFNNGRFPDSVAGETYRINPVGKAPVAIVPTRIRYGRKLIEAGGQIKLDEP